MAIGFLRSLILYGVVIFSVRLMGKRQIGELQPSELVITILVSNIATLPLENLDIPLLTGIIPILSLVCFEVLASWGTLRSRRLRRILSGSPKIIIRDGVIDQKVLEELRFSADDLMTALRGSGVFDVTEVQFAIVETTGSVSVYPKHANRPVTNVPEQDTGDPPDVLISDGKLIPHGLAASGLDRAWIQRVLNRRKLRIQDVFLLAARGQQDYCLIEKEGNGCHGSG